MNVRRGEYADADDPVLSRLTTEQADQLADLLAMLAEAAIADGVALGRDDGRRGAVPVVPAFDAHARRRRAHRA